MCLKASDLLTKRGKGEVLDCHECIHDTVSVQNVLRKSNSETYNMSRAWNTFIDRGQLTKSRDSVTSCKFARLCSVRKCKPNDSVYLKIYYNGECCHKIFSFQILEEIMQK